LISISGTFVYQPPQEAGEFFAAELGTFVIALVIVNDDGSAVLTADPINEQLTVVVVRAAGTAARRLDARGDPGRAGDPGRDQRDHHRGSACSGRDGYVPEWRC
jgi:hypothetical protein